MHPAEHQCLSAAEMDIRLSKLRERMDRHVDDDVEGLFVFSRVNTYYACGVMNSGVLYIPRDAGTAPLLLLRHGIARARYESPLPNDRIAAFKSYSQLAPLFAEHGVTMPTRAGAETSGLPWNLADMLRAKCAHTTFVPGDTVLATARGTKTEHELALLREAGRRHHTALREVLPARIHPGMSEYEIAATCWQVFFELGHTGIMRMNAPGEEMFLGHVSAGDSGNYPSVFNGPLSLVGAHPSSPFMGSPHIVWMEHSPLAVDCGFAHAGYATDKTQVYWSGPRDSVPGEVFNAHTFCTAAQNWLAENLRPGAIPSELYAHVVQMAEDAGMAEGFMGVGGNKVVFVGHGIGLTIDGYPVIARGFDEPLEAGQVLALEPKMGLPGMGMVGVENTFEVTDNGGVCLTGDDASMVLMG